MKANGGSRPWSIPTTDSKLPNSIWNCAALENFSARVKLACRAFGLPTSFATDSFSKSPSAKQRSCWLDRTRKSPRKKLAEPWFKCVPGGSIPTVWLRSVRDQGFKFRKTFAMTKDDIRLLYEYDRWANNRVIQ